MEGRDKWWKPRRICSISRGTIPDRKMKVALWISTRWRLFTQVSHSSHKQPSTSRWGRRLSEWNLWWWSRNW